MRRASALALALLALAGGCAVGPGYRRPPVSVPDAVRGQQGPPAKTSLADRAWFDVFRDQALQGLVRQALVKGFDVRIAAARVAEARATYGVAAAAAFPQVNLEASVTRSRTSSFLAAGVNPATLYDVDLGVQWEVDLWGRVRRLKQAARADYLATEEARRGVELSLLADLATAYFRLRELDLELDIARRTEAAFADTHDLFRRRRDAGLASDLEVASALASLSSTRARIPDLERQVVAAEDEVAFLVGDDPGPIARGSALDAQVLPPEVPPGLPADLLERRPDLRQAEQDMVAANARVGVATASLFPTIRLTGDYGGVAPEVSKLFGAGKTWSFGSGLLAPIFQGGQLRSQKKAAVARWEQARVSYEKSVANAFREVSDTLVALDRLARVEDEQGRAVAAYRDAVKLANQRYSAGLSSYLEVLQAEQQLLPAEDTLARARYDRLAALVGLYKALGGGWSTAPGDAAGAAAAPPPPAAPSQRPGTGGA